MALVACKECGKEMSASAKTCPHCGHKPRRTGAFTWIVAFVLGGGVLSAIFNGGMNPAPPVAPKTPEQIAATKHQEEGVLRAAAGAMMLKKSMRDPDSFKLESALVIDGSGAVCYDYRANNGFGGVNLEHAVLSGDETQFKSSTMDGYSKLWNKECANKPGVETEGRIRRSAL